jgi:hypothetical protein
VVSITAEDDRVAVEMEREQHRIDNPRHRPSLLHSSTVCVLPGDDNSAGLSCLDRCGHVGRVFGRFAVGEWCFERRHFGAERETSPDRAKWPARVARPGTQDIAIVDDFDEHNHDDIAYSVKRLGRQQPAASQLSHVCA